MATQYSFGKIVTDGLVLCLDAADRNSYVSGSTTWFDVSGNNNSGSLINGPTFSTGSGGSIVFDGTNDYVNVGNPSSLQLTTNFTIAAWVKRDTIQNSWPAIVAKGDTSYRISASFDGIKFHFAVTRTVGGTVSLDVGTFSINIWYYMVLTFSPSALIGYVNGSELGRQNFSSASAENSASTVGIGYNSSYNSRYWDGDIANVQIYNTTLSAQEVLQNYNAQKSRFGL